MLTRKVGDYAVKVRCPNCDSSGSVKNGIVLEGGRWIKCPVCKNRFFIEREPSDHETEVVEEGERRDHTYPLTYDPNYHLTDGGDPESEEDLFLFWWFF